MILLQIHLEEEAKKLSQVVGQQYINFCADQVKVRIMNTFEIKVTHLMNYDLCCC